MDADKVQHIVIKLPVPATEEWLSRLERLVDELVGPKVRMEREVTPATKRWLGTYLLEPEDVTQRRRVKQKA